VTKSRVVYENLELAQEYRTFEFFHLGKILKNNMKKLLEKDKKLRKNFKN
jgi:hypothetical protein